MVFRQQQQSPLNPLAWLDSYDQGYASARQNRLSRLADDTRTAQGRALSGDKNALAELNSLDPDVGMRTSTYLDTKRKTELSEFLGSIYAADTQPKFDAVVQRFKERGHEFGPGEDNFANRDTLLRQGMTVAEQYGIDLRKAQIDAAAKIASDNSAFRNRTQTELERHNLAMEGNAAARNTAAAAAAAAKTAPKPMTASLLKLKRETENNIVDLGNTRTNLQEALKLVGTKEKPGDVLSGYFPEARAGLANNLPDWMVHDSIASKKEGVATNNYLNIMNLESIQRMADTLKGATTDFELREFVKILSNPSSPVEVKRATINRMLKLADEKEALEQGRLEEFNAGGKSNIPGAEGADTGAPDDDNDPVIQHALDAIDDGADPQEVLDRLRAIPGYEGFDLQGGPEEDPAATGEVGDQSALDTNQLIEHARAAVAAGADPRAVQARLQEIVITPAGGEPEEQQGVPAQFRVDMQNTQRPGMTRYTPPMNEATPEAQQFSDYLQENAGGLPGGDQGEMEARNPTLGERTTDFLNRTFYKDTPEGRERAERITSVLNWTPPYLAYDAGRHIGESMNAGNYNEAAQAMATAAMPLPPPMKRAAMEARGAVNLLGRFENTKPQAIIDTVREQGGMSLHLPTGKAPDEGIMAGTFRNNDPRTLVLDPADLSPEKLEQWVVKNAKQLGNGKHMGGWVGPDGKIYFDVSQRFPPGKDAVRKATKFAERTGQLATFDVGKMQELPVGNWEEFIKSPEFHQRMDEMAKAGREYLSKHASKEWWDTHGSAFERVYGKDKLEQVAGFLAATAPNTAPRPNISQMTEYMRRFIKGEPLVQPKFRIPNDAMYTAPGKQLPLENSPGRTPNIERAGRGALGEMGQDKVREEALALMGDPNAAVFDRHWARIAENPSRGIFTDARPMAIKAGKNYQALKAQVGIAAKRSGRSIRDYSADVWTGIRETLRARKELFGTKYQAKVEGESKSYADQFEDLIREKATYLKISVNELENRLRNGDATLLSTLLATPVGYAVYRASVEGGDDAE